MRNLYAITRSGRKELREWLAVPPEPQPQRSELLLKLSLGDRVSFETCQKLIRDYSQQCALNGIQSFPTWILPDGSRETGVIPLDRLAEISGCELPD